MSFDSHEGHTNYDKEAEKKARENTHKTHSKDNHNATAVNEALAPVQKPSIGSIVHFVLDGGQHKGEHRPAIITKIWPKYNDIEHVQLQVFTDGSNDGEQYRAGLYWATSVSYADPSENKIYSWHWPERV